jgi:hypothetical protein
MFPLPQLTSLVAQDALPHCIRQLSVTHLHLDLPNFQLTSNEETAEREKQWEAYAKQLSQASISLRYLNISAKSEPFLHWRVNRIGEDIQPTLTRLSRDEGDRISDESFQMSSSQ